VHNLDAMDGVLAADIGKLKVSAMRDALARLLPTDKYLESLADPITTPRAVAAAKQADVLICCVDHDSARLATAILAMHYCRPLLDIGSGIPVGGRRMGGDIRLILPGENRCLWCFGGLVNPHQGRALFFGSAQPARQWRLERQGSLRSLNQINVHLGIRLLEDLINERLQHSTWLRVEFEAPRAPTVRLLEPPANPRCPICPRRALGDAGLDTLSELASAIENTMEAH
jgi:Dinucleotide-utilizing enzymes involved in molybdopterin and thiamine biosynthesis family 2